MVVRVSLLLAAGEDGCEALDHFTSFRSTREIIAHSLFAGVKGMASSLADARPGEPVPHDAGDHARSLARFYGVLGGILKLVCVFTSPPPCIQVLDDDGQITGYQIYSLRQVFQSLLNRGQFPIDHHPLPHVAYIDVDPKCAHLEDSVYKPFPGECRDAFGEALRVKVREGMGKVFLCMSARVFFTLDICDSLTDQQKHSEYCRRKNTLFLASMPGVEVLQQVLWVLVSELASIRKLGSSTVHFKGLVCGCLVAAAAAASYNPGPSAIDNLTTLSTLLELHDLLTIAKEAA